MRSIAIVLGAAVLLSACGGAAQPSPAPATAAPTAAPATAQPTVAATTAAPTAATSLKFTADLKTENEVPPIANDEKSASGKATFTLDLTRDAAGKITAAKASIDATFSGLPATALIHIGHLHGPAAAGVNAGVKIPFKTDADVPLVLTTGATTFKKADITVEAALAQEIIDKPGDYYVNFHSRLNAGGVVRGQLVKG
ncbi:MAG: CHRD domain-containing protein [Chloroflexi bacterium]|nr:CHRD domain-containing protein [Chloroflexota bacterium]